MGLNNSNNAIYLNVKDGKIVKRVKEATPQSVSRVTKNGTTVHEETYPSVTGFLKDIKVHTHEQYGKFWQITIEDGNEVYIVQVDYSGRYASSFLKALPNVDFRQQVTLSPYQKVVNGKPKSSLYINQNREGVKWFFTREEPNGLPDLEEKVVRGAEIWDDTAMMTFLEKYVSEKIIPKIQNAVKIEPTAKKEDGWDKLKEIAKKNEQPASIDDVADGLPF